MIEHLFATLAAPSTPWLLAISITVLALILWIRLKIQLSRLNAAIADGLRVLAETDGHSTFKARFSHVFKTLADNPVLGEPWRAFAPTLDHSAGGDGGAIGYTRRPHTSFNDDLFAFAGINLRFYNAVPNILVGIGLLFTFMGLVAALFFATRGLTDADVSTSQAALRELLSAATFKFVTSIVGLGCSLLFSWAEKRELFAVQRQIDRFCASLEARMVPLTTEILAAAQLAELRAQGRDLRDLGRNLLVRLPEESERVITEHTLGALEPLHEAVRVVAGNIRDLDVVLATTLVEEMRAALAQRRDELEGFLDAPAGHETHTPRPMTGAPVDAGASRAGGTSGGSWLGRLLGGRWRRAGAGTRRSREGDRAGAFGNAIGRLSRLREDVLQFRSGLELRDASDGAAPVSEMERRALLSLEARLNEIERDLSRLQHNAYRHAETWQDS